MTLFELQAWLGHHSLNTTQHDAKIIPNTLAKAYTEAEYFARNLRTIEVLIDRDALASGDAALAALRLGSWLLQLQLLRAMSTSDGLRAL